MGSFGGHVLPGTFFLIFGIWWMTAMSIRYFRGKYRLGPPFKSSVTFPCLCLCGKLSSWQLEGFLKVLVSLIGLIVEITAGFVDGKFVSVGNGQHATMYFMFAFSGGVDLLVHHKFYLPENTDYVVAAIAFVIEGILFKFHLHGRPTMDIRMHTLLIYLIFGNVVGLFAEMRWPKSIVCAYSRAYFTIAQGTWFWQVAFILYNPLPGFKEWDEEDHDQLMLIAIVFAWHLISVLAFTIIISLIINCIIRRGAPAGVSPLEEDVALTQLIKKDRNGQTFLSLESDDNYDFEQEQPVQNGSHN